MLDIFACAMVAILLVFCVYVLMIFSDLHKDIKREMAKMDILKEKQLKKFYEKEEKDGDKDSGS